MKNSSALVAIVAAIFLICCNPNSPSSNALIGTWDKEIDFEGDSRSGAVSFVINGYAYVGSGSNSPGTWLNDFWRYDAVKGTWEEVTDFPGVPRTSAVAFELNGKGYVGTGTGDGFVGLSDFYEFNPDANDPVSGTIGTWKRVANFPGPRYGAIGFSVKNRAFVGTGTNERGNSFSDLWEYDQANDRWIKKSSIIGSKRAYSFVMTINDYVYVGGGIDNGAVIPDLSRFDVTAVDNGQPWSAMNGLTGKDANGNAVSQPKSRATAAAFSIGNFGYLTCGSYTTLAAVSSDTWQYDPLKDSWVQCFSFSSNTPYVGVPRNAPIAFTVETPSGTYGYVATGGTGSLRLDDLWKFDPKGIEPNNK